MERKDFSLTKQGQCGKMGVDEEPRREISCPACGNPKFLRVYDDTKAVRMPVYCKRCRDFVEVNID